MTKTRIYMDKPLDSKTRDVRRETRDGQNKSKQRGDEESQEESPGVSGWRGAHGGHDDHSHTHHPGHGFFVQRQGQPQPRGNSRTRSRLTSSPSPPSTSPGLSSFISARSIRHSRKWPFRAGKLHSALEADTIESDFTKSFAKGDLFSTMGIPLSAPTPVPAEVPPSKQSISADSKSTRAFESEGSAKTEFGDFDGYFRRRSTTRKEDQHKELRPAFRAQEPLHDGASDADSSEPV